MLRVLIPVLAINQQFRKDSDLSHGVVPRWSDNEDPDFGERIAIHQRYQSAGRELFLRQKIRQRSYAKPSDGCRRKSHPFVCFEPTLRVHGDRLVSVNEVPRLRALHETFRSLTQAPEAVIRSPAEIAAASTRFSVDGWVEKRLSIPRPDNGLTINRGAVAGWDSAVSFHQAAVFHRLQLTAQQKRLFAQHLIRCSLGVACCHNW
jgi:hypothetical protein